MDIQMIAALGNNDEKYKETRHNIGFDWINRLARKHCATWQKSSHGIGQLAKCSPESGQTIILFKPGRLMNINGGPIASCAKYYQIPAENLLLVYDDLDLDTGIIKCRQSQGHGGHNGVRDLQQHLPIQSIMRLKIGWTENW